MKAFYVGARDYAQTLCLQEAIFEQKIKRQAAIRRGESARPLLPDVTILVEHSQPVYTVGRRDTSAGLPANCAIQVAKTKRGGGITYHGPGQLTVYPIANIQQLWKGCTSGDRPRSPIEWFSAVLEGATMDTAAHYGVPCHACKTGIWCDEHEGRRPEKMSSIGLQLSSWVSMHGAGFNVAPDLSHFDKIVMCELPGESATSLAKELHRRFGPHHAPPALREVSDVVLAALVKRLAQPDGAYTVGPAVDLSSDTNWEETLMRSAGFLPLA